MIDRIRIDVRGKTYGVLVRSDGNVTVMGDIASDELIEVMARLIFVPGCEAVPESRYRCDFWTETPDYSIVFEPVGRFGDDWNIIQGAEFSGQLTKGEALASLASFIFNGRWLYGGLRTYPQHQDWWRIVGVTQEQLVALLPSPNIREVPRFKSGFHFHSPTYI